MIRLRASFKTMKKLWLNSLVFLFRFGMIIHIQPADPSTLTTPTSSNPTGSPTIGAFFPILFHKCRTVDTFASFHFNDLAARRFDLHDGIGIVAAYSAYGIGRKAFIGDYRAHDFDSLITT